MVFASPGMGLLGCLLHCLRPTIYADNFHRQNRPVIKPADDLLAQFAPLHIWREAEAQAMRSPHRTHKTGAVIFYGMGGREHGEIYSTGCAHPHDGGRKARSTHAEIHAIQRLPHAYGGAICLIVTITRNGNYATCSRPCEGCAKSLSKHCWAVTYVEKCNDGSWAVRREDCRELVKGYLKPTKVTV
jgi:cytidine deaminase